MSDPTSVNLDSSFGLGTSPQVWLFSDFEGYNQLRSIGYPMYLSQVRQARLERIRQARLLHDGRHWRLFLFENRTQFDFPEMRVNGAIKRPFVPYNLLKLISLKSADLLFGEEPTIGVTEDLQATSLKTLVTQTAMHSVLYQAALEASPDAECFIEGVIEDGKVYLKRVDAADVFPEGLLQPDGQYGSYVRYNAKNVGTAEKPDWRLLITRWIPGAITRELKQLDQKGFVLPKVLTLDQWPQEDPAEAPLEPETRTGLDRPSLVWIPNLLIRNIAVSDYDGLVELQDALNAKHTQVAAILAKHANPKLAAPASDAAQDGNLRSDHDVYYFRTSEEIPKYIELQNAQLEAAMKDREEIRDALLTLAEMSPILLGIKTGSTSSHNAYKSVRLEAMNSITKAGRKAVIWKAAIKRLITLAQDLEQTIPGTRYDRGDVSVEMRDGIPVDTDARATEIANLRSAGVISIERAVGIQLQDPAAVQKELAALAEERAAATPSVFLSAKPGADGQEATSEQPGDGAGGEADEEKQDAALDVAA